jgi:anti-sigma factor RsiW
MTTTGWWWQRRRLMCPEVARLLQRYLDGELAEWRGRQVRSHLRACRRCGLQAKLYRDVKASLRRRREPLPADSIERLRAFADRLVRDGDPGDAGPDGP